MKKVVFITNLPSPYRVDFYNELGKYVDLTVLFEGKRSKEIKFNWNDDSITNFKGVFLEDDLNENKLKFRVFKYFKKKKYDVRVISCYYTITETFVLLYMKLLGIPYYFETDGGMIAHGEKSIVKRIKRFLIGGAKGYFSPSAGSDEYLHYYGAPIDKIYRYPFTSLWANEILENPISIEEKSVLRQQLKIKEEKMLITVGQFIHRKGFDILLKSLEHVEKNIGVYIVGGEPIQLYKEIEKELGLTNVHYVPFKTKAQLSQYFKAADLFVLPTREDIWGLVINEAMANGLPVITTNRCVAGVELIANKECIIPVEDIAALSNAINAIINDDAYRNKLSISNLSRIRKNTFENMAQAHINHL